MSGLLAINIALPTECQSTMRGRAPVFQPRQGRDVYSTDVTQEVNKLVRSGMFLANGKHLHADLHSNGLRGQWWELINENANS